MRLSSPRTTRNSGRATLYYPAGLSHRIPNQRHRFCDITPSQLRIAECLSALPSSTNPGGYPRSTLSFAQIPSFASRYPSFVFIPCPMVIVTAMNAALRRILKTLQFSQSTRTLTTLTSGHGYAAVTHSPPHHLPRITRFSCFGAMRLLSRRLRA